MTTLLFPPIFIRFQSSRYKSLLLKMEVSNIVCDATKLKMSDKNQIKIAEEVRHGLFRFKWCIEDKIKKDVVPKNQKKTFKLCGSQTGRAFIIEYSFNKVESIYCKIVAVQETTYDDNSTFIELNKMNASKQGLSKSEESLDESPKSHKKQKLDSSLSPLFIWIYRMRDKPFSQTYDNETLIHLKNKGSGKWSQCWSGASCLKAITVWIDFGMSSVKQENIINTMNEFTRMFHDQINCDVEFRFRDGTSIGAHILILSARSTVFSAMFQKSFIESQTRQVNIDDIEMEVFRQLLIYLYSGDAPKLTSDEEDVKTTQLLFEVADKYAVETLKKECVNVLLKEVDSENVIKLLLWSNFHSITELFDEAMKVLVDNFRAISFQPEWLDFMKNFPDLCLVATQRMSALLPPSTHSTV